MVFVEHVAFLKWKLLLFSLYVPLSLSHYIYTHTYIYILLLLFGIFCDIYRSLIFVEMWCLWLDLTHTYIYYMYVYVCMSIIIKAHGPLYREILCLISLSNKIGPQKLLFFPITPVNFHLIVCFLNTSTTIHLIMCSHKTKPKKTKYNS